MRKVVGKPNFAASFNVFLTVNSSIALRCKEYTEVFSASFKANYPIIFLAVDLRMPLFYSSAMYMLNGDFSGPHLLTSTHLMLFPYIDLAYMQHSIISQAFICLPSSTNSCFQ